MHLFAIAIVGPYAHNEEDEAIRFRDGNGDATSVHVDGREAVLACKHIDNTNNVHAGKVVAAHVSLIAMVMSSTSDDDNEVARSHGHDGNAARACGHDGDADSARKGGVAAVRASLLALAKPIACDDEDETVPFRKHN